MHIIMGNVQWKKFQLLSHTWSVILPSKCLGNGNADFQSFHVVLAVLHDIVSLFTGGN